MGIYYFTISFTFPYFGVLPSAWESRFFEPPRKTKICLNYRVLREVERRETTFGSTYRELSGVIGKFEKTGG